MPAALPVILNAGSGPASNDAQPRDVRVRAAFAALDREATVSLIEDCDTLDARVAAALQGQPPLLVAGGGDGTIAAVAAHMVDAQATYAVLPMGTLNHFAKDLGLPVELEDAARVALSGNAVTVDTARLNDRVFLNNSSLGLYPRIVSEREHTQERLHLGKWPALARATWHALRDPHSFTLRLTVDGATIERRTPFVFIGNNRYQLEGFAAGSRPRLDEGMLSLYVLRPQGLFGFLRLGLRALFGRVRADEDFEAFTAADVEVQSARARVEVALDGEVVQMETPLRYRIQPRSLRVMVPVDDGISPV